MFQNKHKLVSLDSTPTTTTGESGNKPATQSTVTQFVVADKKWTNCHMQQTATTDALVSLVAGKLLPMSFIASDEFRHFCKTIQPSFSVPCRRTLTNKLLVERHALLHNKVQHLVKSAESVCVTIDLWSSRQMRSFIGITGHTILDYSLRSVLFACKRVKGRHTADNIAHHYEEIMAAFDIGTKISAIVTDNATNMVRAFDLPGYQAPPHATSDDDSESDSEADTADPDSEIDGAYRYVPDHHRCFAHTLQLVVKDGLDAATRSTNAISKASAIVSHTRKSCISAEI